MNCIKQSNRLSVARVHRRKRVENRQSRRKYEAGLLAAMRMNREIAKIDRNIAQCSGCARAYDSKSVCSYCGADYTLN